MNLLYVLLIVMDSFWCILIARLITVSYKVTDHELKLTPGRNYNGLIFELKDG
ncbi:hypothetical protein GCM10010954_27360 [Halobacillus andaensis]|uniref:Uncharacterized protein n=1 Tax=Halobacillus andaensis TaxID=1176239 RepID=A0A917EZF9_HALAA|nr:hypothetical protein [Halobacillus andaensis]MBP2005678.1 putative membrane protein YdbT with pleckstrin-like domain [Halobacillus andaensis]GGF26842.1 hypothetical protein GCM10010954_27360 [Halobacillus andaensis]